VGIFGTIWGMGRLREPVRLPAHQRFDWVGSLTFVIGLGSLLLALSLVALPMLPMDAFLVSFAITLVAAAASALRPAHSPREAAAAAANA
jgi:hypothetical protein